MNPTEVVHQTVKKMETSATVWLIIGIFQIMIGIPELFIGYGVACIGIGIWNLVQSSKERKNAKYFAQNPIGLYHYYDKQQTSIIVALIVNLVFGSVIGVVGAIIELSIRGYVMSHKNELLQLEAALQAQQTQQAVVQ